MLISLISIMPRLTVDMTNESRRVVLQSNLGKLLGFDDGVEDVLDHLLTIESKDVRSSDADLSDLAEYLSQLLGNQSAELVEFVDNVCRYQKGDPLVPAHASTAGNEQEKGTPGRERVKLPARPIVATRKQQTSSKGGAALESRQNNQHSKQSKSRVPPPKITAANSSSKNPLPSSGEASNSMLQHQQLSSVGIEQELPEPRVVPKSHPSRGKAKIVCGCFGNKHKPLTNCLYCGRISCTMEGYDYCPFCGLMVEEIKDDGNDNKDEAWIQKERLLRFDREFARRTEIFDDQADYQAPSTWLTEEERKEAEDNQRKHLASLRRPKQTMNLAI